MELRKAIGTSHSFIAVFKTNVREISQGEMIVAMLLTYFPCCEISFDLDDCDKVLRIRHHGVFESRIVNLLNAHGFDCEELQD